MFKKSLNRSVGGNLLLLAVLILMACFMLLPIVYAVVTAFKPLDEIYIFPPRMYVKKPTLSNFTQLVDILSSSWVPISRYVFNSLFVAAVGVTGHVFMASMAAYPMAKHDFVGKKAFGSVITLSLLFTYSVTYIAQYVVFAKIHWINTYMSLIAPVWSSSLGLYLMMAGAEFAAGIRPDRRREGDGRLVADCHAECEAGMDDHRDLCLHRRMEQRRPVHLFRKPQADAECVQQRGGFGRRHCPGGRRRGRGAAADDSSGAAFPCVPEQRPGDDDHLRHEGLTGRDCEVSEGMLPV